MYVQTKPVSEMPASQETKDLLKPIFSDTEAQAVDKFNQKSSKRGLYLNSPWKLTHKVARKVQEDKVKHAALVTPFWPTFY